MNGGSSDEQVCFIYWLRAGAGEEYDRRHRDVWPEIRRHLDAAGVHDYSIFRRGDLVISTLRCPGRWPPRPQADDPPEVATWHRALRPLFSQITDLDGEPLFAARVFRHEGRAGDVGRQAPEPQPNGCAGAPREAG